jgi:subtilisin family serine protease
MSFAQEASYRLLQLLMRAEPAVAIAVLFAVVAAASGHPVGTRAPGGAFAVGYANTASLRTALRANRGTVVRMLPALHVAQVQGADAAALRHAPGIRFVQRVAPRAAAAESIGSSTNASPEWQFRATHTDGVSDSVLRAASAVTIGVIDTGADLSAPDIASKGPVTWNTRTGTPDVRDTNGHGTFVASVAAGSVTNNDGISGAGGDAQLLVVKSGSDGGSFTDMDEAAGITYAIDHGARIINLSVGGPSTSTTEKRAIRYAVDHGALVIAAVGNEYAEKNPVEYPAALLQPAGSNGVGGAGLAVTASTADGKRATFANTGSWVSLAAPGEHVFGALSSASSTLQYPRTPLAGAKSGLYGYASGTSFAAPQVAGAAALVWAANPSLTAQQVAQILKQTASGRGQWTPELGFGVVDVAAAVIRAQQGRAGVLLSGLRDKSRVRLNWSGDGFAYTLSETTDGHATRTLLSSTQLTTMSLPLTKGHTYAFTVSALDAFGAPTATSPPVTFTVKGR